MQTETTIHAAPFSFSTEHLLRRYLKPRLALLQNGSLEIFLPNGKVIHHVGAQPGPVAVISVHRWRMLRRLLLEGETGLAGAYVDGDWSTPDLDAVLEFGLENDASIAAITRGLGAAHALNRLVHLRNANTRRGSRRNIAAHYDLGNAFYGHWLDADMIYSSAMFAGDADTLETAQERKSQRVVDLMDMRGDEDVLEIGCGWGSLACRIAKSTAGSVTGISLSREQVVHAQATIAGTALEDRVEFELRDYRSITEQYDRIVSIEMIEAVGERYWPVYFDRLRRSLNKDGCAVLQIITIADELFPSYRNRPDFIQQYIFPGGMLPTVEIVKEQAARAGFQLEIHEPFALSYARTLDIWHERFNAAWPEIERLGFDDRFRRMWNYYLRYCATGFRNGSVDVGLFKFSRMEE